MIKFYRKEGPNILYYEKTNQWNNNSTAVDLTEVGFQIAFAVKEYGTVDGYKDDTSLVEWELVVWEGDGLTDIITHRIGTHKC
jgi:hypothetical protein